MRKLVQVSKLMVVAVVLGVVGFGVSSAVARPPCFCPDVWRPVICADGNIYSNLCYASCAGAWGCVPAGDDWI